MVDENNRGRKVNSMTESVDRDALRGAMRHWATGVTIVSSVSGGIQHGMTVSSFTSISLDPPMVLISLAGSSRTYELVQRSGVFGVTVLGQAQSEISDRFAGRTPDDQDRFVGLETFTLETGAPFLAGGEACFDCRVTAHYLVGDHTLFVGRVVAVRSTPQAGPLLYYDRAYRQLGESS
jgi:flavin reductase (DIM6/NTAB) family NADH-FMN oxidoreductase RutF